MQGGPRIKHLDEVPAEEMARFQFKDGRTASIWEKWIELSPRYICFWNKWDPGAMSPPHGHTGDHSNLILKGELRSRDGHVVREGHHIMLEWGDIFGPWIAGPEGCELYGFVAGDGSPFMGDDKIWQAFLEEQGAISLPLPMPKRLPPWKLARYGAAAVTKWVAEE